MILSIQILIIGLSLLSIYVLIAEISQIYGRNSIKGKVYILCIPHTDNIEELYAAMINLYRKKGYGEDILICKDHLGENEKNIGNLLETADNGIYLIESKDISTLIR